MPYDRGLALLYEKANRYKDKIAAARPLSTREAKNLDEYFKIGLTFSGNALEGNTRDRNAPLSEEQILKLHKLFYALLDEDNAGIYRQVSVFISGTDYVPPGPDVVPAAMQVFVGEMNALRGSVHPVECAARLHKGLIDIHPFVDGNGRTARLLMNLALVQDGFGIAIIPPVLRGEYIDALRAAQRANNPDDTPFLRLIAECLIETQKDYCRLLQLPTRDEIEGGLSRT
jgi:Fic family protein